MPKQVKQHKEKAKKKTFIPIDPDREISAEEMGKFEKLLDNATPKKKGKK